MTQRKAQEILQLLKSHYPHAQMILQWSNNFELLVAIILSAQCTDKKVNEVTSRLFPKYRLKRKELDKVYKQYQDVILSKVNLNIIEYLAKDLKDSGQARMTKEFGNEYDNYSRMKVTKDETIELVNFACVPLTELEQDIKSTGFYHNKAKHVQAAAKTVLEKYHGILPRSIDELITIPGVGRKTANVFLTNAYHINEGIAVDTHVNKQSQVLGLTKEKTPEKIEKDLMQLFPNNQWHQLTYLLIEHGRNMRKKKFDRMRCGDSNCLLCDKSLK